jgi:hypothetical protein
MRRHLGFALAAMAAVSMSAVAVGSHANEIRATIEDSTTSSPVRRRLRRLAPAGRTGVRRSRGPQAKPKRRSNRLHVSRNVRRKHRRAA